jgi:8-oxo-dGTP pyrophosphatase MutT (NUDIX family)
MGLSVLLAIIVPTAGHPRRRVAGGHEGETTNEHPPPSATLLLVRDDPFEVLMVRRNARGTFASSLVFPGGMIDQDDRGDEWAPLVEDFADFDTEERARRIGAIRETWEETSILVGASGERVESASILTGLSFRDFVARSGVRLRLAALTSLAHWITPVTEPRRFDTRFFVAAAPDGQVALADGSEIVGIEWVSPSLAAEAARRGELPIIFPTLMNLDRLAESERLEAVIAAALVRAPFTVLPVVETGEDGSRVFIIPAEAGYAVTRSLP